MLLSLLLAFNSQANDTTDLREAFRSGVAAAFVLIRSDEPSVRDARHIVIDLEGFKKLARANGDGSTDWSSLTAIVGSQGVSETAPDCAPLTACPTITASVLTRTSAGIKLTVRVLQVNTRRGRNDLAVHDYVVTLARRNGHFIVASVIRGGIS